MQINERQSAEAPPAPSLARVHVEYPRFMGGGLRGVKTYLLVALHTRHSQFDRLLGPLEDYLEKEQE